MPAQDNTDKGLREGYPEFSGFLQACHDGKPATYTATDTKQVLYNQQAVDELVARQVQAAADSARMEQMVTILLSLGGELEITRKAIEEAGKGYKVTVQPTSRLDGGLVYTLRLAAPTTAEGDKDATQ